MRSLPRRKRNSGFFSVYPRLSVAIRRLQPSLLHKQQDCSLDVHYNQKIQLRGLRTVCPFCNWTGKHMLHLAQWKNRSRPPTLHIPQPSQWYWFLSSSSNKLHSRHVYLPNRQWQFWQVACTGWRVSHSTHMSSVTSFLFTVWVSSLSWQNRHVYTLLQHGVWKKEKKNESVFNAICFSSSSPSRCWGRDSFIPAILF